MFDQDVVDQIDETILQLNQVNSNKRFLPQYDDEAFSVRSISSASKYSKSQAALKVMEQRRHQNTMPKVIERSRPPRSNSSYKYQSGHKTPMLMPQSRIIPGMRPPTYQTAITQKQIIELEDSQDDINIYGSITSEHH